MSLNKEIERKWLVDRAKIPFDFSGAKKLEMVQSYISFSPTIRLRATDRSEFVLCVKSKPAPGSLARDEFELLLTKQQYDTLMSKTEGTTIRKTRYIIPSQDGHKMEFDFFEGDLGTLTYMEIEFATEEEANSYPDPAWAIKDVTFDPRYKNASLAKYGMPQD